MANPVITNTTELKLLAAFADEDDRTITIINPRGNLTRSQIEAFAQLASSVIVGDKYGAAFTRFKKAYYVEKTTVKHTFE